MTGKAPGTMIQDGTIGATQLGTNSVAADEIAAGAVTGPKMAAGLSMPAGSMVMFAGSAAPTGWLLCQGQAVNRTANAALFAAIGTTWGAGDGSTTFGLPDLRGRAPIGAGTGPSLSARTLGATGGAETHVLSIAEMPAHTHTFGTSGSGGGGISSGGQSAPQNTSSQGSGAAHNNMQPFAVVNYIIKT
jgi:microcystin-dependent protein